MISHDLSLVELNSSASAELSALTAAYLANGGTIGSTSAPAPAPQPYGRNTVNEAARGKQRRRSGPTAYDRALEKSKAKEQAKIEMAERVRVLAAHMSITKVQQETGINRRKLNQLADEFGFDFQDRKANQRKGASRAVPIADAMDVARIRAAQQKGLSRHQATLALGFSRMRLDRLISIFGIDYPHAPRGRRP